MGAKITEKQFLEMSVVQKNEFIARRVFGEEPKMYVWDYVNSWKCLGKGIEHANENGFDVVLDCLNTGDGSVNVSHALKPMQIFGGYSEENIFLAFFIAYMKALGVLE